MVSIVRSSRKGVSPSNRSLQRGMEILRAFRSGTGFLGNGELAERTGLSRATVSRLTGTLAEGGFLEYDPGMRAYRLGVPLLSLARAMYNGSDLLQKALPLMREASRKHNANVGLACADRDDMVYLESVRINRKQALRQVVVGQRIPIELTSLGRAWLAASPADERDAWMERLRNRRAEEWPRLQAEIGAAIANVHAHGYCVASWQPGVVALAAPIVIANRPLHALNMSVTNRSDIERVAHELEQPLLQLARDITDA